MPRIMRHPIVPPLEGRREVSFSFDGVDMKGFEGEMISSALFANGVTRFSFHAKDGAPQGIFFANGQCSQCTVIVDGIPKKACIAPPVSRNRPANHERPPGFAGRRRAAGILEQAPRVHRCPGHREAAPRGSVRPQLASSVSP